MKNSIISGLLGGIVFFLLGGLFYGLLLREFFENNMPAGMENVAKEPELQLILLADVILGLFLGFIFDKWANIRSFTKGAQLGLILALAFGINYAIIYSATTNLVTPAAACADICVSAVMGAIGGGVIGLALGKLNKV